jgi:ABC-2 type transport system ATP-binding protein
MTDSVIETIHLRKEYGPKIAVEDLTLEVPRGEVFGFLGPNGAGKSTTIKMLLGLVTPTSGQILLFGQSPQNPQVRAKVGFLPEHFRFHEWLQAQEFLVFHGRLYGMSAEHLKKRVPELLELVGLADSARVRLSGFTKGMLQRIGLAQAMLNKPDLIFLDEPTSGLDPIGLRAVRDIIYHLKANGTTVFLNSHLLSEVSLVCDRVTFINHGRVIQTSLMSDLLSQATEVTLRVDQLSTDLVEALAQVGAVRQSSDNRLALQIDCEEKIPQVAQIVHAQGAKLYELTPQRRTLEEIFVNIIEGNKAG